MSGPTHRVLWPNLVLAVRGSKSAKHVGIEGGSVNYRLTDDTTAWILDPSEENRRVLLGHFENMRKTGHMSLAGPKGVACEQGAPAAHRKFNMASVLAVFKFATTSDRTGQPATSRHIDPELAEAAESVILDEIGLTQAFMYKGMSVIPAPRVKDEKGQGPIDANRDRLSWVLRGIDHKKLKVGRNYWHDDEGNLDVILARELVEKGTWSDEHIFAAEHADLPKLYLPINTRHWTGNVEQFEAWIDDTPENRKVMGKDACHFVHAGEDGVWWRYDWEPELDADGKSNNHYLQKKGKNR